MFHKSYEEIYAQLNATLSGLLAVHVDPVKRLTESLALIRKFIEILRKKILQYPFPAQADEILFFKTIKPKFYAWKIYHFYLYGLDMNKPVGTKDMLLAYYHKELSDLQCFFDMHIPLYQYYKTGRSELDDFYFRRGMVMPCILIPEMPDPDPEFSTAMDYIFAKFMAYELLQEEILKRMALLDGALVAAPVLPVVPDFGLKWTGKIVNLGELIYGLYYTGQFNNGNAQIAEIVALFERVFGLKIRDVHHTFGEIKERKVSSPTRFIDSMAVAIQQRVDEDLRYKPR